MKVTSRQIPSAILSAGRIGKQIVNVAFAILLAATATATVADVASRVQESNSSAHNGVLAFVRDSSPQGLRLEQQFFGQGLRKVSAVASDFQIQIVESEDIPGGALPGSFVVLTQAGDRVVAMQHGCKTEADLRTLVAGARGALSRSTLVVAAYFEYDH
jgi:hypothetical protein